MHKLCNSKVPPLHTEILDETDNELIKNIQRSAIKVQESIEGYKFRDALFEVIDLARKGNKYLQEKEPWKKASGTERLTVSKNTEGSKLTSHSSQDEIDNCLHLCLQLTANLAILINPFLPTTAKKMLHMMKVVDKILEWENAGKMKLLSVGYSLRAPELLFRKIEEEEIIAQIEKLKNGLTQNAESPKSLKRLEETTQISNQREAKNSPLGAGGKPTIQYDDFAKLDLKIGTILSAEKIEKADKILKLEIDLGFEKRIIVSGIALHFKPEEIVGKQVVVVANLAPRKMRGIESNGMILMAENSEGKLYFIKPEEVINNGSSVS
jgi:methionyl-tRNA synthetase